MRKFLVFALLLLVGFYVGWPAYSAWQIQSAMTGGDPTALARKIEFTSVRESLRPAVTQQVNVEAQKLIGRASIGRSQLNALLKPMMPKLVDEVLVTLVTPQNAIRIAKGTGSVSERISAIVKDQLGKAGDALGPLGRLLSRNGGGAATGSGLALPRGTGQLGAVVGGLFGQAAGNGSGEPAARSPVATPAATPEAAEAAPGDDGGEAPSFGLSNIKSFGFKGPLAFELGVAQDPNATRPDVTAEMAFSNFDWKIVGIRPRLDAASGSSAQ